MLYRFSPILNRSAAVNVKPARDNQQVISDTGWHHALTKFFLSERKVYLVPMYSGVLREPDFE